jgi:hypothetical protein
VARVVAAVIPRDDFEAVGEKVDDLPLTLVSPLAAQDGSDFHGIERYQLSAQSSQCSVFGGPLRN